jgi:hypothetical protein
MMSALRHEPVFAIMYVVSDLGCILRSIYVFIV